MRVLFVNSVRSRGGGVSSGHALARGLADAGHEVTVACNAAGELLGRLRTESGISVVPIRFGADYDPFAAHALARTARRARAEVALADRRKDVKLLIAARLFGPRVPIVHRHGAPSVLRDSIAYRMLWRRIQAMIVNSAAMRSALLRATPWLESIPIEVIPNGVDASTFRPLPERRDKARAALRIPAGAFVIAYHGTLQRRKRVDLLIRAVATMPPQLCSHLLLIGDGPDRRSLERLACSHDVNVTFTGARQDVADVLSAADAAAHLSSAEGFSNTVLEDMACGLPVVATDEHSHAEQIVDGVTGHLVAPEPFAVADALSALASDPGGRALMGGAARETAARKYTIDGMVRRYWSVLSRAAGPLH